MPILHQSFFQEVEDLKSLEEKFRWYMVLIVTLSSMNFPDEVPNVFQHFSSHYLPLLQLDERLLGARKIREALTKSVGIVGAAKVCVDFTPL
jgi:predicted RNA-binding protein with PUA-like domain